LFYAFLHRCHFRYSPFAIRLSLFALANQRPRAAFKGYSMEQTQS
jgi:hypothetical protein